MSLAASAPSERPVLLLRYIDVVLIVIAAPIMLLIGVPATGYCVGAGAWIVLRVAGVGMERYAEAVGNRNRELTARMMYLLSRIFLLALTVVLVRRGVGQDDALTALLVIVFAFTMQLVTSLFNRPRSR